MKIKFFSVMNRLSYGKPQTKGNKSSWNPSSSAIYPLFTSGHSHLSKGEMKEQLS